MDTAHEINERYSTAIHAWAVANGHVLHDLTNDQALRFVIWQSTGCDVSMAAWIWRQRLRYAIQHGRIGDGVPS